MLGDGAGGGGVAIPYFLSHLGALYRRGAGITAAALAVAAAVGLLAGLAAGGLLLWGATGIVGQLSHADSSLSASGMT